MSIIKKEDLVPKEQTTEQLINLTVARWEKVINERLKLGDRRFLFEILPRDETLIQIPGAMDKVREQVLRNIVHSGWMVDWIKDTLLSSRAYTAALDQPIIGWILK
jgi:hypothetical protein